MHKKKKERNRKPRIIFEPPGPKSRQVIDRYNNYISDIYSKFVPLVIEGARGSMVRDMDGNTYIDLTGGNRADSVGYQHPKIVQAAEKQVKKLIHVQPNIGYHPLWADLSEKLQDVLPGSLKRGKFVFLNSGSEAVDAGMKLARFVTGNQKFVAFYGSFHGRTYGATSLSTGHYTKGYSPMVPGVVFAPYPYCYRCYFDKEYPDCGLYCLDVFERDLDLINAEEIAAIVLEPMQGVGGILIPPPKYLSRIRKICNENVIFMMVDEIETGFGITGKMFAVEHWGVTPDILIIGKTFGGGLPLSATIAKEEIMDQWPPGAHGTTTGGCLVACAAAIEVIAAAKEQIDNTVEVGAYMIRRLREMQQHYDIIGDVRGRGLFMGIELVKDTNTKKPATEKTNKVVMDAFRHGVLFSSCGLYKNVVRIMAPTCLTKKQAEISLDVLDSSFKRFSKLY